MNTLPDKFYIMPNMAETTMSKKDLKELLLFTEGWIIACGKLYDIMSKNIGASIYKITLKERNHKP